ncbi:MAG: PAS domain-containing protein [Rhizomicrobium sp.]|jgi:hypothetical protein
MDFTAVYKVSARADILRLARYCDALAGTRKMPLRRDFRPTDVTWLLGRIYLIDVMNGGADYSFRLFGIFWEKMYGTDLTGQRLSEIEATGRLTVLRGDYDTVVAARAPLFHPGKLVWPNQKSIHYERLLIPFSDDNGQVSVILAAAGCDVSLDDLVLYRGKGGLPRLVLD